MAAKFEINLEEALRQIAEFQLRMTGLGKHIDQLNQQSQRGGSSAAQLMSQLNKSYESLQKSLLNLNSETRRSKEAIDAAFSKIRSSAAQTFERISKANLDATVKAQAYSGALKDVERVLSDTAKKNVYAQAMQKIATIQEKSLADAKVLTYQIQQLATAQGQVTAELRNVLASETRLATARSKQATSNKELDQQLKLLNTTLGQANSVLKARIQNLVREQQEETKSVGRLEALKRSYDSLSGGMQAQIAQQQAMNQGLVQAATFREREINQLSELRRRQDSLNGGFAEQVAQIKVQNQAREQQITQTARYIAQQDQLRAKQASLLGGQAEEITRIKAQVQAREQQIKAEERQVQALTQLTQAEAQRKAQDESSLRSAQALNNLMLERARATQVLTQADAQAIASAEKLRSTTKARSDALLEEARAAHGMSKAQQELNAQRQRERDNLERLKRQHELLTGEYGRELAMIQQQIRQQEALNRLRAMSIGQLFGLTSSQERHNQSLNAGAQLAASMRAALTGLGTSFGMYTSGTIVAASATYAFFNSIRDTISVGSEFTASLAQANAVMNSNRQSWQTDNFSAMEMQVRALGQTTVFTASEVAKGLIDLGQAGLSSGDALLALKPALDMAQIGNISMSESADIATNVMMVFGKEAGDLTRIVDIMATAAVDSNTNITQLANALSYAGPAAHAAGITLEETTAAIEVLSNSGIKASRAGTALRKLFTSLLNPTEKGTVVLSKYNIAVQNLDGSTRGLADIIRDLNSALNATGVSEAERLAAVQDLVGLYATSPVAALIANSKSLDSALMTLEYNVAGAAERMRKKMSDTLKVDWKTTLSAYEELQLQVYDKFEAYLRYTSARITKTLLGLTEPIKAVIQVDGQVQQQSIQQLVDRANAGRDAGSQFSVQDRNGVATAVDSKGQAASIEQLTNAMNESSKAGLTLVTQLDLIIERTKVFAEAAAIVLAGWVGSKGLGLLTTALTGVGQVMGELTRRAVTGGGFGGVIAGQFGRINAAAASSMSVMRGWWTMSAASISGATGLWGRFGATASAAMTGAALAARGLTVALAGLSGALGIAAMIGSIGYALYTVFSSDNEEAIANQKKEVEALKEGYKGLLVEIDAMGNAKERQAMVAQVEQLKKERTEYEANTRTLKAAQEVLRSLGEEQAKMAEKGPLALQIKFNEDQVATIDRQLKGFNEQLENLGTVSVVEMEKSTSAISALTEQIVAQRARAEDTLKSVIIGDDSGEQRKRLYDIEMAKLDQLINKLDQLNHKQQEQAFSAMHLAQQIAKGYDAAMQAAIAAGGSSETNGQVLDRTLTRMAQLTAEISELQKKSEAAQVVDPQIAVKQAEYAKLNKENYAATVKLAQERAEFQKSELAAELAGADNARKKVIYTGQIAEIERELASIRSAPQTYTGQERERELITRLTTAKNGLKAATDSVDSANRKAQNSQDSWANKYGDFIGKQNAAAEAAKAEAAAYASGSQAIAEYQVQKELTNEVLQLETQKIKLNVEQRKALEDAIRGRISAEQERDIKKDLDNLRRETADIQAQTAAVVGGEAALRAYNQTKQVEQMLLGADPALRAKVIDQVKEEARARQAAAEQLQRIQKGEQLFKEYNKGKTLAKEYAENLKALEARFNAGGYSAKEFQVALKGLSNEYEDNKAQLSIWGKLTQDALNRVDEAFVDMWKNIGNGFSDFKTSLINSFKQMLAEMAHAAITRPIMISFVNSVMGTNKSGGIGDVWSNLTGGGGGGGGGIMGMVSNANTAISIGESSFMKSVMSGWEAGGESITSSIAGAFKSGSSYVSNAVTSAFSTGSQTASTIMANGAQVAVQNQGAAMVDLTTNTVVNSSGEVVGTASGFTQGAGLSPLQNLSMVLSYIQGVYTIFTAFQNYGLKGAAVTAGTAAAGAYIGSFFGPLGTAAGFAIGAALGAIGADKWFGTGEKYTELATSASGTYSDGTFKDRGWVEGWKEGTDRFGTSSDQTLTGYAQQFSTTLGMLYDTLGNGADVSTELTMRRRRTSGNYSSTFQTTLDNGETIAHLAEYGGDVEGRLKEFYDDYMGTFLAQAIVKSESLPEYFRNQFQQFANDWEVTAETVINAIQDVFTRFNGVNAALSQINVKVLDMGETGLKASDSILNMVAAMSDLDMTTATAKDKVEALNTMVSGYYDAFFTDAEKFEAIKKTLTDGFGAFYLEVPATREAYRAMVEDIDVTTEAGQGMFATMMGLAKNADSYYTEIARRQEEKLKLEREGLDTRLDAVKKAVEQQKKILQASYEKTITSLNADLDKITESIDGLSGLVTSLEGYLKTLRGTDDSVVAMAFKDARVTLQAAVQTLRGGGSLDDLDAIKNAAEAVAGNTKDSYRSLQDYLFDQGVNAGLIDEIGKTTGDTVTKAETQIDLIKKQIKSEQERYEAQIKAWDDMLENAQLQLDALDGIDISIKSVEETLLAFQAAMLEAITGSEMDPTKQSFANNLKLVESVYQSVLGREADEGAKYWVNKLMNGELSYAQLSQAIASSASAGSENSYGDKAAGSNYLTQLVESIYKNQLGREADAGGLAYWLGQLNSGQLNAKNIQETILNAEAVKNATKNTATAGVSGAAAAGGTTAALSVAYQQYLGREADAGGMAYWQNEIATGKLTLEQAMTSIRESQEAKSKFATGGAFTNQVVKRPTAFDLGEMGEAGPEAIMPLANIGGQLGVLAKVSGGDPSGTGADQLAVLSRIDSRLRSAVVSLTRIEDKVKLLDNWDVEGLPPERT